MIKKGRKSKKFLSILTTESSKYKLYINRYIKS